MLHDFRRTVVRDLVRAGVAERVAMQLVGWRSRRLRDRYHIVNAGNLVVRCPRRRRDPAPHAVLTSAPGTPP